MSLLTAAADQSESASQSISPVSRVLANYQKPDSFASLSRKGILLKSQSSTHIRLPRNDGSAGIVIKEQPSALMWSIWNWLLFNAYESWSDGGTYYISRSQLRGFLDRSSYNMADLDDAIERLVTTRVEYYGKSTWLGAEKGVFGMLSGVIKRGRGWEYSWNPQLHALLTPAARCAYMHVDTIKKLRGAHEIRLYEVLSAYLPQLIRFSKTHSRWYTVDELRQITSSENTQYQQWYRFREKVIDRVLSKLESTGAMHAELEVEKAGRQVERVRFLIKRPPQKELFDDRIEQHRVSTHPVYDRLIGHYGFDLGVVTMWTDAMPMDYIAEALAVSEERTTDAKGNRIKSKKSYVFRALSNAMDEAILNAEETRDRLAKERQSANQSLKRELYEELRDHAGMFKGYQAKVFWRSLDEFPDLQQERLDDFLRYAKRGTGGESFREDWTPESDRGGFMGAQWANYVLGQMAVSDVLTCFLEYMRQAGYDEHWALKYLDEGINRRTILGACCDYDDYIASVDSQKATIS